MSNMKGFAYSEPTENYNQLYSSMELFSHFQLLVLVLRHIHCMVQSLINPLYASCSAPNSRQTKLATNYEHSRAFSS